MITEAETQFYERLANQPAWRVRCGFCRCPRWAHKRMHERNSMRCSGCGKCRNFTTKKGTSK